MKVNIASSASADNARRVKRAHSAIAQSGRPVGDFRPFGWDAERVTIREDEGKVPSRGVCS